jgi:hypothetical protein
MKLQEIKNFINWLKNISDINSEFGYIWYDLSRESISWNSLIFSDLDEWWNCFETNLIELRIIWWADITAFKIKELIDLLHSKLVWSRLLWFNSIQKFDESRMFFNSDNRFEKVITYKIY